MKLLNEIIIRLFDLVSASLALIILFPFLCIIAIWIKIDSPGPVLFKQKRLGYKGKIYWIYKFRTMINGAEKIGLKSLVTKSDSRITRCGRLLRLASIDELPQLINVLKGDMSIVGPRPGLPEHLNKYSPRQRSRLEVRPGITGKAQIHGRNALSWPERIEYDLWYVKNRSLLENLKIILKTFPVLFKKDFIYGQPSNFSFGTGWQDRNKNTGKQKTKDDKDRYQPHVIISR